MNAIRRSLTLAAGLALVLTLGACDPDPIDCSQNPTGPGCPVRPTPTPTPELPRLWDSGQGGLPAFVGLFRSLAATPETGTLEAIVDWTFAANDLDVLLARGSCSLPQLVANQCNIVALATGTGTKQERIRATNQPAGTYTFIVLNFGPGDESIAYQVLFTRGTSAASAARGAENGRLDKGTHLLRGLTRVD